MPRALPPADPCSAPSASTAHLFHVVLRSCPQPWSYGPLACLPTASGTAAALSWGWTRSPQRNAVHGLTHHPDQGLERHVVPLHGKGAGGSFLAPSCWVAVRPLTVDTDGLLLL